MKEGRGGGGGGALMHVKTICIGTHSQPLLQNRLMDVYETKIGRDEVLMAPHLWLDFSANLAQGQNRLMRGPFSFI